MLVRLKVVPDCNELHVHLLLEYTFIIEGLIYGNLEEINAFVSRRHLTKHRQASSPPTKEPEFFTFECQFRVSHCPPDAVVSR